MPAVAPLAILLGGVGGDRSLSMRRYALELFGAISQQAGRHWRVELIQPAERRWLSRIWPEDQVRRMESAVARYVLYPVTVLHTGGDLFHVLDHAYGHLVRALDPAKTVVTCHDVIPLLAADGRVPIPIAASVVRTVRLRVKEMLRARMILTDSAATRSDLLHYTNVAGAKVRVVSPGINPIFAAVPPAEVAWLREMFDVPPETAVILQVVTRGRYKNTPALLKALALLRRRMASPIILARVGVPFYDDEAALARRLGVTGAVRQLGVVDDPTLARWYQAATVLAFPSLWEGFGWPPLEAMASGTPVVASRIPAIVELAAGAAAFVDPADEYDLAAALERVISDPTHAAQLRARGLVRSRQLTWASAARRTLAVYRQIAPGHNGGN